MDNISKEKIDMFSKDNPLIVITDIKPYKEETNMNLTNLLGKRTKQAYKELDRYRRNGLISKEIYEKLKSALEASENETKKDKE